VARLIASLAVACLLVGFPGPAWAFGTIDGAGQHREHERITRAALACHRDGDCFQPRSADQLAGDGKRFGAVGAPDLTEVSDPAAHCDDADFLAGPYPQTREAATAALRACVDHLRLRFREAIDGAAGLLAADGRIVDAAVRLDPPCAPGAATEQRAKCGVLESFGRALHGVQDFYSHSNWADVADATAPLGTGNPPGLGRPAPSPILDLRGRGDLDVPPDLTTGCFVPRDRVPGVGRCERRITHAALNKDNGLIDPGTGDVADPGTPRGKPADNFAKAVAGAVIETRHQWQELRVGLERAYGTAKASLMACALTHDDPLDDCGPRSGRTVVVIVLCLLVVLVAGIVWLRRRRAR
jgi:hypothetical protein